MIFKRYYYFLFFWFLKVINESIFLDFVIYILNIIEKEDGYVCYYVSNYVLLVIYFKIIVYCGIVGWYVIY